MSKFEKSMEEIFDVTPKVVATEVIEKPKTDIVPTSGNDYQEDLNDAYEQTKTNLQDLIDQGKDAMEELRQIASAGQHPRAFEVYATLLKNVVDANKELLAVQKQIRELEGIKKSESNNTNIDKAIFVGSTAELGKLLKNKE